MKKALKITIITLGSLVVLALVLAGVAVWMLTSSGQLTKMVNKYAPQYVNCDMALGEAKLTLFKTFPNIGVDIKDVALINPMEGSPSDTLAYIDNLVLVMDADKLRKEKEIVVRKCILEDAFVNLYTDSLGNTNFDVFSFNKEDDSTSSFDYLVDVEEVRLKNTKVLYSDKRNGLATSVAGLDLNLKGKMKDKQIEADLMLASKALSLQTQSLQLELKEWNLGFEGEVTDLNQISGLLQIATPDIIISYGKSYLEHDTLDLHLPLQGDLKALKFHLEPSRICLNHSEINLSGDAELAANKDVVIDMNLRASDLVVEKVLTYLPEKMQRRLSGIDCSGKMDITESTVKGVYNDSLMPVISANITTDKANVNVTSMPHPFTEVDMDVVLYLDLNKDAGSTTINSLKTCYNKSRLSAKGLLDDLLGDIGLKLKVNGNVPMTDVKDFVPKTMKLGGRTNINLTTDFTYQQLKQALADYDLNQLSAKADLRASDFSYARDTLHVAAPLLSAHLVLPASAKQKGCKGAFVALNADKMSLQMGDRIHAELKQPNVECFADNFNEKMEKMPLDAKLDFGRLNMVYDSINVHMDTSAITFATLPKNNSTGLKANIALKSSNVVANMGLGYAINTYQLSANASINQKRDKNDFLNRWNPEVDFVLDNAEVKISGLDETIRINTIDFLFNDDELDFKKSTFRIGQSDLSLQGNVSGIKDWIADHKNLMKGELQVTSDMLNINEILDMTSGLGSSNSSSAGTSESTIADPFIVPEGVDFSFGISTKKALYDNFDLNNLGGGMTIKDGTLILQEIGFTNKAAEMQLTALYQSPRRNNLFLAMDFHLLNVQINDLLHLIPYIDTLVPMLKTFDGQAEFHIGAETNLKANYEPKISTLRAAADIEGKNLTVTDQFTFTHITDMLDISTNGNYRIDSLDVQLTAFRDEIDLWPSQIAIGKYKVTLDGRMTLDKKGEYHLSVTQSPLPVRLGLKVSGPLNKMEYKLEDCKYPNLYKPNKRSDTDEMYIELKKRIADRLKENVR